MWLGYSDPQHLQKEGFLIMTKSELINVLSYYEDDEEIDIAEIERESCLRHVELINELEERQHATGFYAFQDLMDMYRRERQALMKGELK